MKIFILFIYLALHISFTFGLTSDPEKSTLSNVSLSVEEIDTSDFLVLTSSILGKRRYIVTQYGEGRKVLDKVNVSLGRHEAVEIQLKSTSVLVTIQDAQIREKKILRKKK